MIFEYSEILATPVIDSYLRLSLSLVYESVRFAGYVSDVTCDVSDTTCDVLACVNVRLSRKHGQLVILL